MNIAFTVVKVDMFTQCDTSNGKEWNRPCEDGYIMKDRLSDFTNYRSYQSFKPEPAVWHLFTKCTSDRTQGIAWIGRYCVNNVKQDSDGFYKGNTGVTSVQALEWKIFAHELGHNFGANHDCNAEMCTNCQTPGSGCDCCSCGQGDSCDCSLKYLMGTRATTEQQTFSKCSLDTLCSRIFSCAMKPENLAAVTFKESVCGNGVLEANEQCDCGPADGTKCTKDTCCDGKTCTLKSGAQCSDQNDPCCDQCQKKSNDAVCGGEGYCFSGQCYVPSTSTQN